MSLPNEIVLRPRFKFELPVKKEDAIDTFQVTKNKTTHFIVSKIDDHIFIKIPKSKQHFWSPHLHLEITFLAEKKCSVNGFFGPNPSAWTFFIFIHVIIGTLFIAGTIWAYSNYSLGNSFSLQLAGLGLLIVLWFGLYFIGRIGRAKGKPEMQQLYNFMLKSFESVL